MMAGWYIKERLDEVKHGVFATTFQAIDQYGNWRGDYVLWERANERVRRGNRLLELQRAGLHTP
jgi:N-acyl-L-homoserine lactone synthetase